MQYKSIVVIKRGGPEVLQIVSDQHSAEKCPTEKDLLHSRCPILPAVLATGNPKVVTASR